MGKGSKFKLQRKLESIAALKAQRNKERSPIEATPSKEDLQSQIKRLEHPLRPMTIEEFKDFLDWLQQDKKRASDFVYHSAKYIHFTMDTRDMSVFNVILSPWFYNEDATTLNWAKSDPDVPDTTDMSFADFLKAKLKYLQDKCIADHIYPQCFKDTVEIDANDMPVKTEVSPEEALKIHQQAMETTDDSAAQ